MGLQKNIAVTGSENVKFHNNVDFCVGTGRMGLALQKEYYDQLKLVQEEIGFSHIRGHGLFSDDMAIYRETTDREDGTVHVEYCFTYLDLVMDSYISLGIKPFLELGFMPEKLASGTQTIFYWKGNTTPPKSYEGWCTLVTTTLKHLMDRYGADEVVTWPIEVWNEPNLPGFWENADKEEYFKLFKNTFYAIKELDPRFQVGGPAVCGGTDEVWIRAFLDFCHAEKIPVDYVTRHHYTSEMPQRIGHYGYIELMKAEDGFANLHTTRDIIDSFEEYKGLNIHVTEFNTSYIPNAPIHDTNQNAAFLAEQLTRLGDDCESYSYWTFGDIFEEQGVPYTPFHGGFGMVANGCIPKPTFWTFAFFKQLKEAGSQCVYKDGNAVIVKKNDGGYAGVVWNHVNDRGDKTLDIDLTLDAEGTEYCLLTKTVDETCCNPLKVWHEIGEPANPTKAQNKLLREAARPLIETKTVNAEMVNEVSGKLNVKFELSENAVKYFDLSPVKRECDRGYDYTRVMRF